MRHKYTRMILVTMAVLGCGAVVAASLGSVARDEVLPQRVLTVATSQLQPVTTYTTLRVYTGTLVAARTAELSFERAAEVTALHADQGDRVAQGELLATLKTKGLQAKRGQLVAQRAQAQSVLDELEAGPRPETIAAARAEVRNLAAQVELQRLTLQRRQTLLTQRAVSRAEYDQSEFGLQSAEAVLEGAQQKLAELEAGTRAEQKAAQQAAVAQLDAAIAGTDADLEQSRLTAPFAGTVVARHVDEGTVVSPGQIVLRLLEDSQLEAWFGLPVAAAERLKVGDRLAVLVEQREYPALVKAVLPELDMTTRTRRVVLALASDAPQRAYPGQIARLTIDTEVSTDGFWLPTAALSRGHRGLWSCFVANAEPGAATTHIEQRDVEIVHTSGQRVLVRGMLQAGDTIVSEGTHRVTPGQVVQVASH